MSRELASFAIQPSLRAKLTQAGFRTVSDLVGMKPLDLAKEASVSPAEALSIINTVLKKNEGTSAVLTSTPKTALDMLEESESLPHIITFCCEIDAMLGGGVPIGEVTEFCGVPGIGKTQMGIQLAVDVHLPLVFGGADGHAIYIDTEGSFMPERAAQIAQAFVVHVRKMVRTRDNPSLHQAADQLSVENILETIHFCRVLDWVEQIAAINTLGSFLDRHPSVKLIVIDSVAFHFRHDFEDFAERSRLMASMSNTLTQLAKTRKVAVVLINQVTTKVGHQGDSFIAPALGESWSHLCSSRIMLSWEAGSRIATLEKSTTYRCESVPYQITADGVRGMPRKRQRDEEAEES